MEPGRGVVVDVAEVDDCVADADGGADVRAGSIDTLGSEILVVTRLIFGAGLGVSCLIESSLERSPSLATNAAEPEFRDTRGRRTLVDWLALLGLSSMLLLLVEEGGCRRLSLLLAVT